MTARYQSRTRSHRPFRRGVAVATTATNQSIIERDPYPFATVAIDQADSRHGPIGPASQAHHVTRRSGPLSVFPGE
ncbi:hypothetical protein Bpla01_31130 [Burkholderia plantarii]|nr:hypothetical protein Bpla01_31130 [Burkholderia plantarii]